MATHSVKYDVSVRLLLVPFSAMVYFCGCITAPPTDLEDILQHIHLICGMPAFLERFLKLLQLCLHVDMALVLLS